MFLLVIACSTTSTPQPAVSDVSPPLACGADPVTFVVNGSGFAPVTADVLAEPHLALPTLELARVGDINGNEDGDLEVHSGRSASPSVGSTRTRWSSAPIPSPRAPGTPG